MLGNALLKVICITNVQLPVFFAFQQINVIHISLFIGVGAQPNASV